MVFFKFGTIKTDVTAVKILNNYILAGVGGYLHICDRSLQTLTELSVFEGFKIHGIETNSLNNLLVLYGGIWLKVFACNAKFDLTLVSSAELDDWILSAKWLDNDDIALVCMNNKLLVLSKQLQQRKSVTCQDKCILYSACICYNNWNSLIVLSGTVFSEILVWKPSQCNQRGEAAVLSRLKGHNGVIFCIYYNEQAGYICSSSDDRSSILWSVHQPQFDIVFKLKVYGHQSRVYRCQVLDSFFLTAGEDSVINVWDFEGNLLRKVAAHQAGCIWALDSDSKIVISGGGDCAVNLCHLHQNLATTEITLPDEIPKQIGILDSNLAIITERGALFYYVQGTGTLQLINVHDDLAAYSILQVSKCRRQLSLSGFNGQIYIYGTQGDGLKLTTKHVIDDTSRIFSFHWLTCHSFITCSLNGKLSLLCLRQGAVLLLTTFILPESKERWSTSACSTSRGRYIVGDRKGNVYVYALHSKNPVQVVKKVHNHLGITHLCHFNNGVICLGRNAVLKTFSFATKQKLKLHFSDKLPFAWLARIINDIIIGFSGKNLIVWDCKKRRILMEIDCSGGHRSWDFDIDNDNAVFVFIKDKAIHKVSGDWNKIRPTDIIQSYHAKEVNCLKLIPHASNKYVLITGGEDTCLKVSTLTGNKHCTVLNYKSHLSSIRSVCLHKINSEYLVFSGGGRGQIICWKLLHDNIDCNELFSYYEQQNCEDSEMRVMDLTVAEFDNDLFLFAACSDGHIQIFQVCYQTSIFKLRHLRNLRNELKCVTKIAVLRVLQLPILLSMTTDGYITFWYISNVLEEVRTFGRIRLHQSGINSCSFNVLQPDSVVLASGGDDNSVAVNLLRFTNDADELKVTVVDAFRDVGTHCAQVTGIHLFDQYCLTTSIDQRLAVFKWRIDQDAVKCEHVRTYKSAVADIQGMECVEVGDGYDVVLYGKGMEFVRCSV